jgi:hypothetical protein
MENIGKKLVEKYCKHEGYGNYSVKEDDLIKEINNALNIAWQEGAETAQSDAAKEIKNNYVPRVR